MPQQEAPKAKDPRPDARNETALDLRTKALAASAVAGAIKSQRRTHAKRLLAALKDKKSLLVTAHRHADPDAIASALALGALLRRRLKGASVTVSIEGSFGGGLNAAFAQDTARDVVPWDESRIANFDAVILLDVQPAFRFSPLPASITPTAVIDHHRTRGRLPRVPFCDVRTNVGATSSIIFSYFMELKERIEPRLAAMLLFAIETDLAGAAGQPGDLDNLALSSLMLMADTSALYKMRYVDLPQTFYIAYAAGLNSAVFYPGLLVSHLDSIASFEMPAVVADLLLRFEKVQTVLVIAQSGQSLILSLRTSSPRASAADIMRKLLKNLGEGGGHRSKAGGIVPLTSDSPAEAVRVRYMLLRRILRAFHTDASHGQRLVPAADPPAPL